MFFRKTHTRTELSDPELIIRYKNSADNSFVGVLFERYAIQIFSICRRYLKNEEEAKDMSMRVFEFLLKDLLKYEIQNFKPWLARAVKNYCLMELRSRKSLMKKEEDFKVSMNGFMEREDFLHLTEEDEKEKSLQKMELAIKLLKPKQRQCVELFYLEEKSYVEVAELTGFSLKEVKSFIQNGKRNLKIKIDEMK